MSKKTKTILAVVLLLVVVAAAVLLYLHFSPKPAEGAKTVTVTVVHGDETQKDFVIHTDAETLRAALEQESLIEGTEGEWGLYVLTVDGETADESIQQWWNFTKDGEDTLGVDATMVSDGDHYEITLRTGW